MYRLVRSNSKSSATRSARQPRQKDGNFRETLFCDLISSYISPSRMSDRRSIGAFGKVSRNHPDKKRTCSGASRYVALANRPLKMCRNFFRRKFEPHPTRRRVQENLCDLSQLARRRALLRSAGISVRRLIQIFLNGSRRIRFRKALKRNRAPHTLQRFGHMHTLLFKTARMNNDRAALFLFLFSLSSIVSKHFVLIPPA